MLPELGLSFLRDWGDGIPLSQMGGVAAGLVAAAVIGVLATVLRPRPQALSRTP